MVRLLYLPYGYEVNDNTVGGLSGITFNSNNSFYYLVADKPPARIFKVIINNDEIRDLNFAETSLLTPALVSKSELEGIAYNHEPVISMFLMNKKVAPGFLNLIMRQNLSGL